MQKRNPVLAESVDKGAAVVNGVERVTAAIIASFNP
jgi:hypothetical protein